MLLWLTPALLALTAPPPGQSDEARAVVQRAIAAHGGAAALDRYPAGKDTIKGVVVLGDQEVEVTGTLTYSLPGRNKTVVSLDFGGRKSRLTQVIDGDRVSAAIDGEKLEMTEEQIADLRHAQHASDIFRLTLLLADPDYTVKTLGEARFGDRTMVGVLVQHKKHRDVKVWFDKQTGLIARMERQSVEDGQEKPKELLYSDYREFGGIKVPCREVILLDGRKTQDLLTTARKPLEKVAEKELAADD
jgi:hypothetical protein